MSGKRKVALLLIVTVSLFALVVGFIFIRSSIMWSDAPRDLAGAPANSSVIPATEPQAEGITDYSKITPLFTSSDFLHDLVIMDRPDGSKIASTGGVYFIESAPGTIWVWNRPWGRMTSDFACEVVGRVASGSKGAWSLFLTNQGTPHQGIRVTLYADQTLEIGPNVYAKSGTVETHIAPFKHPAIKPGTEFNKLLIVLRGQDLEVFVNGVSVCDPVPIQQRVIPGVLALSASAGTDEPSRAEFTSCTVWPAAN